MLNNNTFRQIAGSRYLGLALILGATGCKQSEPSPVDGASSATGEPLKAFTDVAREAGFTHTHHKPVLDHKLDNIMSWVCSVGAAAAAGDFNRDGWIDLYVTDSKKGYPNFLYRNNGDGTFTDVAEQAGVADLNGDQGTSMDCIWGDYDNDGWIDLYVLRWGNDALFHNNGDGTFSDVTSRVFKKRDGSPGTDWANGNAVIFWDFNLDGRLDIYVGNYFKEVDLWHLENTSIMHDDFERARNGGENFLYRQESDGTFREVAVSLGLEDPGWTLALGSADVNNDGWPDLYCADDFGPDQIFLSDGKGTLVNATETAIGFDTKKGMNVDFGDINNDGWLDIYITNITTAEYLQEGNMLWHNNGLGADGHLSFTDVSLETGTHDCGWGWGAKMFDYDHDGDLDIVAVNGFISAGEGNYWYDLASWTTTGKDPADARNWPAIGNRSFSGNESIRFWRNDGFPAFTQRAAELGIDSKLDGRSAVTFDYDNDGDLDLFVANQNAPPHLYRNNLSSSQHFLTIVLEVDSSTGVNRDAVHTRVTVMTPGGTQIRERDGGNGYCGQSDPRLHFGLGDEAIVKLIEVRWPDGGMQYLEDVPADQILTVRQDPSHYADRLAIKVSAPKPMKRKADQGAAKAQVPPPEVVERLLGEIEKALRDDFSSYARASEYRSRCAKYAAHERAIDFFEKLSTADPASDRLKVEWACALIDKMPTCGGIAAVVSKGMLARKALDQLDIVLKRKPDSWEAVYCRAMNHLHWPRALRHSDDAEVDFRRCIELQSKDPDRAHKPFYVRAHVGLGDALTKLKQYDKARKAWQDGLKLFPDSQPLEDRLAIHKDGELLTYVEGVRNLEQAIDTGLAFLDEFKDVAAAHGAGAN
ncbi:MAG: VCBS repeat-containing protein [Planctomycetes bacterium]|nr:VCBS repeat-containing protein [Planctomycetota bacterium]